MKNDKVMYKIKSRKQRKSRKGYQAIKRQKKKLRTQHQNTENAYKKTVTIHTGTHNKQHERKQKQENHQSSTSNKIKYKHWRKKFGN